MTRNLIATTSTRSLAHNLRQVRQAAPQAKIRAVVKADAYGHGLPAALLNRLGLPLSSARAVHERLRRCTAASVGFMTHFANADLLCAVSARVKREIAS